MGCQADPGTTPLRVSFCFSPPDGIGGAERSMLRLMTAVPADVMQCNIFASRRANPTFHRIAAQTTVPFHHVEPHDWRGYYRLFRETRPHVAYFFGRLRTLGWILAARAAGVRCLVGAERSSAGMPKDWISRRVDGRLLDGYVTNSRLAAHNLERLGISRERIFVVYNGVDPCERPIPEVELGAGPRVVCVANILPNKGHLLLVRAVSLLRSEHPGIRAILVGKDRTKGRFERAAEAEGISDCYAMTGFAPDVRGYLAAADVFALPSLLREGTPTSILEAMLAGVPVVASRIGGVSELIADGRTGLLVDPGNPEALSERIGWLLKHRDQAEAIAQRAALHVRARHSVASMIEGHLRAFRGLLKRTR